MSTVLSDPEILANVGVNVARLLKIRKWSQRDLARKTGETDVTISRVIRGTNMVGGGVLARIAEALDVSIDRLVGSPPEETLPENRKSA